MRTRIARRIVLAMLLTTLAGAPGSGAWAHPGHAASGAPEPAAGPDGRQPVALIEAK